MQGENAVSKITIILMSVNGDHGIIPTGEACDLQEKNHEKLNNPHLEEKISSTVVTEVSQKGCSRAAICEA